MELETRISKSGLQVPQIMERFNGMVIGIVLLKNWFWFLWILDNNNWIIIQNGFSVHDVLEELYEAPDCCSGFQIIRLITIIIMILTECLYFIVILYEKYGMDPMKRSLSNRVSKLRSSRLKKYSFCCFPVGLNFGTIRNHFYRHFNCQGIGHDFLPTNFKDCLELLYTNGSLGNCISVEWIDFLEVLETSLV